MDCLPVKSLYGLALICKTTLNVKSVLWDCSFVGGTQPLHSLQNHWTVSGFPVSSSSKWDWLKCILKGFFFFSFRIFLLVFMSVHFSFVNNVVDRFKENLHVYRKRCSSSIKLSQIFTLVTSDILYRILSEIYLMCIPL